MGLGRIAAPDAQDGNFPVRALLAPQAEPLPDSRYWYANAWWGDQGGTSMCVEYAWQHWLADGPVTHPRVAKPIVSPVGTLYHEAQLVDEWPGEDYDGTSVRAAAKYLQAQGLIESYHWAFNADEVADTVLGLGPVVMGTNWYQGMFYPDEKTGLVVPTGYVAGGHAWKIDGANRNRELFRAKNSWGRSWGKRGHFYITFADLERLISEDGEACLAIETAR
jgi:hypothetical protein